MITFNIIKGLIIFALFVGVVLVVPFFAHTISKRIKSKEYGYFLSFVTSFVLIILCFSVGVDLNILPFHAFNFFQWAYIPLSIISIHMIILYLLGLMFSGRYNSPVIYKDSLDR